MTQPSLSPRTLQAAEVAFWLVLASGLLLLPDHLTLLGQILVLSLIHI